MIIGSATVQANQLQGLRGLGDLAALGENCTTDSETGETQCFDDSGNIISDNPGVITQAGGSSIATGTAAPSVTSGAGGTNWGNLLSSIFGDAASVASTALRSSSQTCQVVNGQTVCTTNTTGGALPVTSTANLLGGSSSSLLWMLGLGAIVLVVVSGKR